MALGSRRSRPIGSASHGDVRQPRRGIAKRTQRPLRARVPIVPARPGWAGSDESATGSDMAEGSASILTEASRPDGRVRLRGITSDRAAGRVTDGDQRVPGTAGDLAGMLRDVARRHRVPGAQLAVHQHGDTVTAEFGELEHGAGRAVSPETAFPVGSISKVFTATLAMILVADGDLELDVPLHECLPELGDLGREITLRHVLSHTSGLASGPASEDVSRVSLRRYVVGQCHRRNLVLPPGTGFSYSNVGYAVAGLVI